MNVMAPPVRVPSHIEWHSSNNLGGTYGANGWSFVTYEWFDGRMRLRIHPGIPKDILFQVNACLPNDLWLSGKNDRWWVTEPDGLRRPYHGHITYNRHEQPDGWWYSGKLRHPNPAGVSKTMQHLVRKWAAVGNTLHSAMTTCSLCLWHEDDMMARTLDNGAHEREHLLRHVLEQELDYPLIYSLIQLTDPYKSSELLESGTARYTIAKTYAFDMLRSTDE